MARTYVIGDIHGALLALQQIIAKIDPQPGDKLIFLGDYVDGWSQSSGVISYLMEIEQQCDCIFLKGNHDAWCESWLAGEKPDNVWLFHGGISTVESYEPLSEAEKQRHLDFYNRMLKYHIDEENRLFIHAGFASLHGPDFERYEKNYMWDRTLWEMAVGLNPRIRKNDLRYPKRLRLFSEIFIGHTPTINYGISEPMKAANVWNVDTGAAFTGRLSALNIDTKKYFQSDVVRTLYPQEKGRNQY